jgi:hypothetical protein
VAAEALALADFLAAARDNELEDMAFKRRRGLFGLGATLLLAFVSWLLLRHEHEIKVVTEASCSMLGLFMLSPAVVGVRANRNRISAFETLRKLLMTPGADANAIEQTRQFLKTALGGSAK